jgi:hypothetical protein
MRNIKKEMKTKMETQDNNKRISLENIPRKNPMTVPENYFESLEDRILAGTVSAKSKSEQLSKVRTLNKYWKISIAAAASFIILIGVKIILDNSHPNPIQQASIQTDTDIMIEYAASEASIEAIPNMESAIEDEYAQLESIENQKITPINQNKELKTEELEEYYDKSSYFSIFTE